MPKKAAISPENRISMFAHSAAIPASALQFAATEKSSPKMTSISANNRVSMFSDSSAVPMAEKSMPKAAITPNNRVSMFSHSTAIQNRTSPFKPPNDSSSFPSDSEIVAELRNILATADLMTVTKKKVRETLGVKFGGIDLKSKREFINQMIDMILKGG
jgi:hypothetical protein